MLLWQKNNFTLKMKYCSEGELHCRKQTCRKVNFLNWNRTKNSE